MKAIICSRWCKPEDLEMLEVGSPNISPNQVKVAVHAAGVNFPDTLIIEGKYQFKPELPFSPGSEIAGEIIEVGEQVENFTKGDRVMAAFSHGGFAEEVCINYKKLTKIPESMDYIIAASMSLTYGTSSFALFQRADIKKTDTVLIHGSTGGVGITALEISKAVGAKVIATASNEEKLKIAKDYGADYCINYSNKEFKDEVKEITNGKGADIIYDPVGGSIFEQSLRCIAWNGKLLVIGFASGKIPSAPANLPLLKNSSIVGVFWGAWTEREPEGHNLNMKKIFSWWKAKKINPRIYNVYDFDQTNDALYDLLNRKVIGKAVIKIR
mgnify:CR=1 FL=1|tara:strand:+ start:2785 stop:3762 length:978 start_codon:yes stop_codon:yes gene_type:complete